MKSISALPDRHVLASGKPGEYHSFPDIARTPDGELIVALNIADKHVATHATIQVVRSEDDGRTWSEPILLNPSYGNCPRISVLQDGELVVMNSCQQPIYRSRDGFRTFTEQLPEEPAFLEEGLVQGPVCIPDRMVTRLDGSLGCISQVRLGCRQKGHITRNKTTAQSMWANMFYVTEDNCKTWYPMSVVACEHDLSFCEISACRLPDKRLIAILRENTFDVYEPMYFTISDDDGLSWSPVKPMPMIGHRPCVGVTQSGKLLITYRDVSLQRATNAWLGTLEDLGEFAVHRFDRAGDGITLTDAGLVMQHRGPQDRCNYILRPLSDPRTAAATLQVKVKVDGDSEQNGIHFGGLWWAVTSSGISCKEAGIRAALTPESTVTLHYERGRVSLQVDGQAAGETTVEIGKMVRPILIGHRCSRSFTPELVREDFTETSVWKYVHLHIDEPRYVRVYDWNWTPADGLPEKELEAHTLQLKDAGENMWGGDYGYSGWVQLPDGDFLCAYHHRDAESKAQHDAYTLVTRFSEADFPQ